MKINWHAVGGLFVTVLGIASQPAILGLLSPIGAAIVTGAGAAYSFYAAHSAPTK